MADVTGPVLAQMKQAGVSANGGHNGGHGVTNAGWCECLPIFNIDKTLQSFWGNPFP